MVRIQSRFVRSVRSLSYLVTERRLLVFEPLLFAEAQPIDKLEVMLITIDEIIRRRQHAANYSMIRSTSYNSRSVSSVET
jgi:hypothetical protein